VLVYHAISIWVPGLGGLIAFSTRRARTTRRAAAVSPSWPGGLLAPATETDD
jgi:hypothetical protein